MIRFIPKESTRDTVLVERYEAQSTHTNNIVKLLCPFHTEKTPSCIIDYRTLRFHCFGCGVTGNVEYTDDSRGVVAK